MFEELKRAWQEAVRNFRRELEEDDGAARVAGSASMRRALDAATAEARRLAADIDRTRRRLDGERAEEAVCRRRESLAREIDDVETAEIAARFAERHAERAAVLERKLAALEAEHALWRRDLDEMENAARARDAARNLGHGAAAGGAGDGSGTRPAPGRGADPAADLDDLDPAADAFRELERAARERAAAERLEELKRRRN